MPHSRESCLKIRLRLQHNRQSFETLSSFDRGSFLIHVSCNTYLSSQVSSPLRDRKPIVSLKHFQFLLILLNPAGLRQNLTTTNSPCEKTITSYCIGGMRLSVSTSQHLCFYLYFLNRKTVELNHNICVIGLLKVVAETRLTTFWIANTKQLPMICEIMICHNV